MTKILPFLLTLLFGISLSAQPIRQTWEIQGSGLQSPFVGTTALVQHAIVTGISEDLFFIQCADADSDNDPLTSDGLAVRTNTFIPGLNVGDVVNVEGLVLEEFGLTALGGNLLEVTVLSSGSPLPTPVTYDEDFPSGIPSAVPEHEQVEGMRITFSGAFCGPALFFNWAPLTANGKRPFREPGILWPGLNSLPVWDGNPEMFWFDANGFDQPDEEDIVSGMQVNATGVMSFEFDRYVVRASQYSITGDPQALPAPEKGPGEITIASLNCLQLRPDIDDLVTREKKIALYIADQLGMPDVVALQEVGNLQILQELIYYLKFEDPDIDYTPYLLSGNDQIELGYLVRGSLTDVVVTQLGKNETFDGGSVLHDRPPLLLRGKLAGHPATEIQVLNLHMRSLNGIEGGSSGFVKAKRDNQARSVANMVQARQDANLVVVGDYNAYPFSDGYVDVTNQIAGTPSLGAQIPVQDIVSPPLHNQATIWPDSLQQYSFVFLGNAQVIDNCLTNALPDWEVTNFAFARGNTDWPELYEDDPATPLRSSDHDGFVLYLKPKNATAIPKSQIFRDALPYPNPIAPGQWLSWKAEVDAERLEILDASGKTVFTTTNSQSGLWWPLLPAGRYSLRLRTADGHTTTGSILSVAP